MFAERTGSGGRVAGYRSAMACSSVVVVCDISRGSEDARRAVVPPPSTRRSCKNSTRWQTGESPLGHGGDAPQAQGNPGRVNGGSLQSFEAKVPEFSRGIQPTASGTVMMPAFTRSAAESGVRIRTLRGVAEARYPGRGPYWHGPQSPRPSGEPPAVDYPTCGRDPHGVSRRRMSVAFRIDLLCRRELPVVCHCDQPGSDSHRCAQHSGGPSSSADRSS
jgi:hypothetical protein